MDIVAASPPAVAISFGAASPSKSAAVSSRVRPEYQGFSTSFGDCNERRTSCLYDVFPYEEKLEDKPPAVDDILIKERRELTLFNISTSNRRTYFQLMASKAQGLTNWLKASVRHTVMF